MILQHKNNIPRTVSVGIMSDKSIRFVLNGEYACGNERYADEQTAFAHEGKILWNGVLRKELVFSPCNADATFTLCDVTIGKQFHWERKENEVFRGVLRLIVEGDNITAVNDIDVEDYLVSVISSEMKATASPEYLRAQAVVSRSWLMRILLARQKAEKCKDDACSCASHVHEEIKTDDEGNETIIRWYENDAHQNYDVCADDHCQRYEGITRVLSQKARDAVEATRGEVLMYGGEVCDARFSKCCGGKMEVFSACWDDKDVNYLLAIHDGKINFTFPPRFPRHHFSYFDTDLTIEENAQECIRHADDAYCNTDDAEVLSQVLNDYDLETKDFFRWHVTYTQQELQHLIRKKLGRDVGEVVDLIPARRGKSGRIVMLTIKGTKKTITIGKELEIRRALSETHLKSSAFVVDKEFNEGSAVPDKFVFTGLGWGHGVGMCQIGAAVRAARGQDYKIILRSYYLGTSITNIYE